MSTCSKHTKSKKKNERGKGKVKMQSSANKNKAHVYLLIFEQWTKYTPRKKNKTPDDIINVRTKWFKSKLVNDNINNQCAWWMASVLPNMSANDAKWPVDKQRQRQGLHQTGHMVACWTKSIMYKFKIVSNKDKWYQLNIYKLTNPKTVFALK